MDDLKLYYSPTCMYCIKVLRFMEQNGITLELRSTAEPQNREYLITHGGMSQVPCLFIGDKPLYESNDIIAYLRKRFVA